MKIDLWDIRSPRTLMSSRVFSVRAHQAQSRVNPEKSGEFYSIVCPDWINIIALTDQDEVVFVKQFRHGTQCITLEIPGGMVDPGESLLEAGLRELEEETGYRSNETAQLIGCVEPNPAIQTNQCGTLLIAGVRQQTAQNLDPNEEIEICLIPLHQVPDLIRSGEITNALVVAAFHHLHLHRSCETMKSTKM